MTSVVGVHFPRYAVYLAACCLDLVASRHLVIDIRSRVLCQGDRLASYLGCSMNGQLHFDDHFVDHVFVLLVEQHLFVGLATDHL